MRPTVDGGARFLTGRPKKHCTEVGAATAQPKWKTVTQHMLVCHNKVGATLTLVLTMGERKVYNVVALEVANAPTVVKALETHAHHLLGDDFKNLKVAVAAAEKYAKAWLKKTRMGKTCACGDIEARPSARRRRA